MKAQEFFDLTKKVRAAQKLFYKTRLNGDLFVVKRLEADLDKAIKAGLDVEPSLRQAQDDAAEIYSEGEYIEQMELIENSGDGDEAYNG